MQYPLGGGSVSLPTGSHFGPIHTFPHGVGTLLPGSPTPGK